MNNPLANIIKNITHAIVSPVIIENKTQIHPLKSEQDNTLSSVDLSVKSNLANSLYPTYGCGCSLTFACKPLNLVDYSDFEMESYSTGL